MKRNEIFRCSRCGLVVEIRNPGAVPVCCGQPMEPLSAKTVDAGSEKHLPVIEALDNGTRVKVGAAPHPMTPEHHIQWIEIINGDYANTKYLDPNGKPEAEFYVKARPGMRVRSYCNIHGLWEA